MKALPDVSEYLANIGAKGGRIGGKATGARKKRSPAHYKAMVKARRAKAGKVEK